MDVGNAVGALVQISGDVGGEQDAHALPLQLEKHVRQVVPADGVKAAGGLVQDQQLRPVGHGQRQAVLHPHACGKGGRRLVFVQAKHAHIAAVSGLVPAILVEGAGHGGDGPQPAARIVVHPAGHEGHPLADFPLMARKGHAEEADIPRVGMNKPREALERSGLARAIAADQAHDFPLPHGEARVIEGEGRIALGQLLQGKNIHMQPPLSAPC